MGRGLEGFLLHQREHHRRVREVAGGGGRTVEGFDEAAGDEEGAVLLPAHGAGDIHRLLREQALAQDPEGFSRLDGQPQRHLLEGAEHPHVGRPAGGGLG